MEDKTRETPVNSSFFLINLAMFFVLAFTGALNLFSFNRIAFTLIIPFILANLILHEYYLKYKENFYYKKHVTICRVIAVILTVILCGSPIMMTFFNRTKPFYHLKQAVYSLGICNISEQRTEAFPDFLPWKCKDYYFRIKPLVPFPEGTNTFACVSFYTDKETIEKYEREFAGKGYKQLSPDFTFEDFLRKNKIKEEEILEYYETTNLAMTDYLVDIGVPWYLDGRLADKTINLSHDVIVYDFSEKLGFSSGCILDYNSGIVVFWA